MQTKNQEISFEVAEKNETVTVAGQPPAKLQPHHEDALKSAQSQEERAEI